MKKRVPLMDNERVPEINFFKRAFKKFEKNLEKDYEKIMKVFLDAFNSYPILPLYFSEEEFLKSFEGYRVISEEKLLSFGNRNEVKHFSHPTEAKCPAGRFNIAGSPVLYMGSTQHTAIEEKRDDWKIGDSIYVSKWQFKKIEPLTYIMLFYKYNNDDSFKSVTEMLDKKMEDLFRHYTKDKRKSLKYFLQKITELSLSEDDNKKAITSALGHYYFYKAAMEINPTIGFIVYPSVKKKKDGYNYAVNPKLLTDDILVCTEIQKYKLNDHSMKESALSLEEIGIVNGNNVEWKKFGYRFESAKFFNNNNESFLSFEGEELKHGRFNKYENDESLTVKEFLYEHMKSDILKDLVGLAKMNREFVLKQYNCTIPESIEIDKTECKKLEFKIKFHYT